MSVIFKPTYLIFSLKPYYNYKILICQGPERKGYKERVLIFNSFSFYIIYHFESRLLRSSLLQLDQYETYGFIKWISSPKSYKEDTPYQNEIIKKQPKD